MNSHAQRLVAISLCLGCIGVTVIACSGEKNTPLNQAVSSLGPHAPDDVPQSDESGDSEAPLGDFDPRDNVNLLSPLIGLWVSEMPDAEGNHKAMRFEEISEEISNSMRVSLYLIGTEGQEIGGVSGVAQGTLSTVSLHLENGNVIEGPYSLWDDKLSFDEETYDRVSSAVP